MSFYKWEREKKIAIFNCITQKKTKIMRMLIIKRNKHILSFQHTTGKTSALIIPCVAFAGHSSSPFSSENDPFIWALYEGFAFAYSCSLYAACQPSNLVVTCVILKWQARSGSTSQSLESNHQRVVGPDRIRIDTPFCA